MAGHSEVENQGIPPVGADKPIFGPAAKSGNPRSRQTLSKIDGKRPAQIGPSRFDSCDALSVQHALQTADRGFDFRELWHRDDMAKARQAR
jgi:hypothetical protein